MSNTATEALSRLGRPFVLCDVCGSGMRKPRSLDDNRRVVWVYARLHGYDKFYYVCSPRCSRRVKEGRVDG